MLTYPSAFGLMDATQAIQYSFISVGIWWAIFSLPIILFVDEPKYHDEKSLTDSIKDGLSQFKSTFDEIRNLLDRFLAPESGLEDFEIAHTNFLRIFQGYL